MTPGQYQQWRDFATRMARTAYAGSRRPTAAWILERALDFIGDFEHDHGGILDWDTCADGGYGVCDRFADFESDETPCFDLAYRAEMDYARDDDDEIDYEELERRSELARAKWQAQYMGPVACCVRAGLDMATRVTGGVVCFTVGDLHAMYPEGIPAFVQRHYDLPLGEVPREDGIWL